jgi:hypothetical protein
MREERRRKKRVKKRSSHNMWLEAQRGDRDTTLPLSNLALDRARWSGHYAPATSTTRQRPDTLGTGGGVGLRAGLDGCEEKILHTHQGLKPECSSSSKLLYQLRYPDPNQSTVGILLLWNRILCEVKKSPSKLPLLPIYWHFVVFCGKEMNNEWSMYVAGTENHIYTSSLTSYKKCGLKEKYIVWHDAYVSDMMSCGGVWTKHWETKSDMG